MAFVTVLHRGNRARCETLWTLLCRSAIKWISTHSGGILLKYLSNYTAQIPINVFVVIVIFVVTALLIMIDSILIVKTWAIKHYLEPLERNEGNHHWLYLIQTLWMTKIIHTAMLTFESTHTDKRQAEKHCVVTAWTGWNLPKRHRMMSHMKISRYSTSRESCHSLAGLCWTARENRGAARSLSISTEWQINTHQAALQLEAEVFPRRHLEISKGDWMWKEHNYPF